MVYFQKLVKNLKQIPSRIKKIVIKIKDKLSGYLQKIKKYLVIKLSDEQRPIIMTTEECLIVWMVANILLGGYVLILILFTYYM